MLSPTLVVATSIDKVVEEAKAFRKESDALDEKIDEYVKDRKAFDKDANDFMLRYDPLGKWN